MLAGSGVIGFELANLVLLPRGAGGPWAVAVVGWRVRLIGFELANWFVLAASGWRALGGVRLLFAGSGAIGFELAN